MEGIHQNKEKLPRVFYSCFQYIIALGKYNFARLHDDQTGNTKPHNLFEIARRGPLLPKWSCYQPEETLFGVSLRGFCLYFLGRGGGVSLFEVG